MLTESGLTVYECKAKVSLYKKFGSNNSSK